MLTGELAVFAGIIVILFWQVIAYFTKPGIGRNLLISAFILYLSLAAAVTLFPVPYECVEEQLDGFGCEMNLVPFKDIISTLGTSDKSNVVLQLLGNVVLCVPYGIMLPFLLQNRNKLKLLLFAPLLSICIETTQFFVGFCLSPEDLYRAVDIDDVILNTIGTLIGYLIYSFLPKFIKSFFRGKAIHSKA